MDSILGIDPGSRVTGYGIINTRSSQPQYIASGVIRVTDNTMSVRLKQIYQGLIDIITEFNPQCVAIEQVFMHRNANSAIVLGQARGVALLSASMQDLTTHAYSPRQIKQAVVGFGGADKAQVQHMVCSLLSLGQRPAVDAADALAVALCHAVNLRTQTAIAKACLKN